MTSNEDQSSPLVLISGAGLAGLMLGILLARAGIEFYIFERAAIVKNLGSAMVIGPTILLLFEQLDLWEELDKFSTECRSIELHNEKMKKIAAVEMKHELTTRMFISGGYTSRLFARADLNAMLLRHVPSEKIFFGKKILRSLKKRTRSTSNAVTTVCTWGDILVGADRAYRDMSEKGILPKIDSEDLVAGYTTMVGVTKPLDPEKYPQLKGDHAHFQSAVNGDGQSWTVMVVPGNVITWGFSSQYKSLTESKKQMFMISEWGPEHNQSMIDDFYNLPCPYGGIMGDLIDATPKDLISKVYLEHKMFQTWHYKRSILVGDACHKMLPAGGQVALNAFHDTVILANCLYDLKDTSQKSITSAFQSYYEQRFPLAKMNYNNSQVAAKLLMGATWTDRLVRTVAFKCIPDFLQQKQFATMVAYRPQANFLPTAPHRGSGQEFSQPPSVRYTKEQAEKNLGSFCPVAI